MVIKEILDDKFCKHYSDLNLMIKKKGTDEIYSNAIDILPCKYEYEETDIEIEIFKDNKIGVINNGIN